MELISPPDSADVQDFQFKLQRKLHVFNDGTSLPKRPCNLLAAASYYGLVFIGTPSSSLLVYHVKDLVDRNVGRPLHRSIPLPSCPEFVSLSCDQQLLAVTVSKDNAAVALIYNVKDFDKESVEVSREIRLSPTPGASICSLQWNPCLADTLAVCCSAGNLAVYQLKSGSLDAQSKPANAICLCWSPKGKQIVVGNKDGTLSQYKPDLTLVKEVKAPQIFPSVAQALAIHWVSNYQYVVVYRDPNDEDGRPNLTIINTPKGGSPNCINYDDICFSMGNQRPAFYYLWQIMNWNVILAASSNSIEVGVLGCKDGNNWQHWTQVDEARAELPLTEKKQESYPVGLAFDTVAIHQIPWGESELPPMPMVHLLSHTGLLVTFNVINLSPAAVQVCSPPLQLLQLPELLLTSDIPGEPAQETTCPNDAPQPRTEDQNPITFTPVVPKAQSIFSSISNQAKLSVATKLFQPTLAEPPQVSKSTPVVANFGAAPSKTSTEVPSFGFGAPKAEINQGMLGLQMSQPSAFAPPKTNQQRPAPVQPQSVSANVKAAQSQSQPDTAKPAQSQSRPVGVKPTQPPPQLQRTEQKSQDNNTTTEGQYKALISARAAEDISIHLLEEANSFQHELYQQLQKWRDLHIIIGSEEEIEKINSTLHEWDCSELRTKCDVQQLKDSVDEMKADLVRACAVLAEASSRPSAHELEQDNRLDPVLASLRASLQRRQYYATTQLQQASRALDQRWQAFQDRLKTGSKSGKGDSVRLPAMDNVYQPLVRQQEILSKQKYTLAEYRRILKNSGFDVDNKSKLLNAKAFDHNANDTLNKLSKNMLNMSLDTGNAAVARYNAINQQHMRISPAKINNLRNLLTAHQTVKIKPVRIEISDKSTNHSSRKKELVPTDPLPKVMEQQGVRKIVNLLPVNVPPEIIAKPEKKVIQFERPQPKLFAPISSGKDASQQKPATASFTSLPTLPKPPLPAPRSSEAPASTTTPPRAPDTFMGQKICSPSSVTSGSGISQFGFNTAAKSCTPLFCLPATTAPSIVFGSSPTDISNMASSIDLAKPIPTKPITAPLSSSNTQPSVKTADDSSAKTVQPEGSVQELNTGKQKSIAFGSLAGSLQPSIKSDPSTVPANNVSRSVSASTSLSAMSTPSVFGTVAKEPTTEVIKSTAISETIPQVVTTPTSTFSFTQKFSQSQSFGVTSTPSVTASSVFSTVSVKPETASVIASPATSLFASANKNLAQTSIFKDGADSKLSEKKTSSALVDSENTTAESKPSTPLFGGTPDSRLADLKPEPGKALFGATQLSDNKEVGSKAESKVESKPSILFGGSTESKPAETSILETTNKAGTIENSQPSLFGNLKISSDAVAKTTSVTAVSSVFGSTSSATSPASIFAAANAAASISQASSIFGSAGGTSRTTSSMFGSQAAASPTSVFGTPATPFGAPTTATSTSVFGTSPPAPATTSTSSVFGAPSSPSNSSVFGLPNVPSTTSSIFGSSPGGQSVFGTAASSGFMFGSSPAGEVTNMFGATSLEAQTPAQAPQGGAGSVFGSGATFGQAQNGGSIFGTASSTGFGSFSKPISSGTSIFGGSSGPGAFGGGAFSSPVAPGPFSGGAAPNQQSSSAFGAAPAFGSSPVFGSRPAFGQASSFGSPSSQGGFGGGGGTFGAAPAFGSPPAFGAAPAFGATASFGSTSPPKFGSSPGFGAPTQQSSTFENLAGQNTIGFGNLAQHTPSPPALTSTSTFNKSPSFSNWR